MAEKKKKLGADLPPGVVDGFNEWCDRQTLDRGGVICAALKIVQEMPIALRVLALSGQLDRVSAWLESGPPAAGLSLKPGELAALERELRATPKAPRSKNSAG